MPDGRRLLTREHGVLAMVLAIALLHALVEARVRPLYQVADEMAYVRAAQLVALDTATPSARACIAPPDGVPLDAGDGGKRGFRVVTGHQLRLVCQARHGATLPVFALRAWQALSLMVVAWAAWYLGRLLSGRAEAGLLAALLVAVHPVAAVFAGGVTPDAWANAFAAGAFVAATRLAIARDRWWDPWLLGGCILGGLLWKDTTNALVALVPMVVVVRLARHWQQTGSQRRALRRQGLVALLAVVVFAGLGVWMASALWTPYVGPDGTFRTVMADPFTSVRRVVADAASHAPGVVASSLLSLYRPLTYLYPDPHQPLTPSYATLVFVAIAIAALGGGIRRLIRGGDTQARGLVPALVVWMPAMLLCALQPSIRQVVVDVLELHQGRWLFPLLAPVAALAATGVLDLVGYRRGLPLLVLGLLASLWIVILDVVRHYYLAFPGQLASRVLFTRPTGDVDIGDARVLHLIGQAMDAQSALWTWGILVLLGLASLGLAVTITRREPDAAPHV